MDRYHVPCNMINFEVTEVATQTNPKLFVENARHMSGLGTIFTLDAFHVALSRDNVLFEAPFRQIKLSRAFLHSSMSNETNRTLLKHTIALLRDLNFEIVAVGIETIEQADALSVYGCHYYQGFYYSHPLTESELLDMFK